MQTDFGPDDQLQAEASQSLQVPGGETRRAGEQAPLASSPLFFRSSSPANPPSGGVNMSSPPQAYAAPSDGDATPRASGQTIGGKTFMRICDVRLGS